MNRRKQDVLTLNGMKCKGKGKSFCGNVKGIRSRVNENERAKGGVAKLLSEEM